jgi:hypothetical protein
MRNAFCQSYQTTDFSKVTEKEVLDRIEELNAEYRKLKCAKKEHKDGPEIRRTRTCISLTNWKGGIKTGLGARWYTNGALRELINTDDGTKFIVIDWKNHALPDEQHPIPYGFYSYTKPIKNSNSELYIDVRDYCASGMSAGTLRSYIKVSFGGYVMELQDAMAWGGYQLHASIYPCTYHGDDIWVKVRNFFNTEHTYITIISRAILSIRQYSKMFNIVYSKSFLFMLAQLEACVCDLNPLDEYTMPEFPGKGRYYKRKVSSEWVVRRLQGGQKSLTMYENGEKTHGFILSPDGCVRRFTDYIHGFVTNEHGGLVSIFTFDGIVIARTEWRWQNHTTNEYKYCGKPSLGNIPTSGDMAMPSIIGAFTFKSIIEKFYPDYMKHFDESWEQNLSPYRKMFPDIKPVELPDVPVTH